MPYNHAVLLFRGQSLNYTCAKCGTINQFNLKQIKHIINEMPAAKRDHFYDYLSTVKEESPVAQQNNYQSDSSGWIGVVFVIALIIGGLWLWSHYGPEENSGGKTYNYLCAYEADKLAQESQELRQKSIDMGCDAPFTTSDALYVKCLEIKTENDRVIREWKALSCTDDSLAP